MDTLSRPSPAAGSAVLPGGVPERHYAWVEGWGMTVGGGARVLRPRSVEEVRAAFDLARAEGRTLALRGAGCSYGDASTTREGHVLDLSAMRRLLRWDPDEGIVEAEPGVTIADLWRHILSDGHWPKVVSGTMFPTLGGALGMNIHGKNAYRVGTIGDNTLEIDLATPAGEVVTCDRERNADLFHATIGGFGMLGVITRIVMRTQRVHSGDLEVRGISTRTIGEMLEWIEAHREPYDYLVGWIDAFPGEPDLGRGLIHAARYLAPGEDPEPERTLALSHQELPPRIAGLFPKSEVWRILRLLNHDLGMRLVNWAKFHAGRLEAMRGPYRQSHAAFNFLLDYVPNWKWAYGRRPGYGLIQYQSFLPHESAREGFEALLERCRAAGIVSYLGVVKRHRPDPFWLTHGLDGWSLALDFKVTPATRERVWRHCRELAAIVHEHGGRFYFAKDSILRPEDVRRYLDPEHLAAFGALKRRCDPEGLLATDLSRRLFPDGF